MIYIDECDCVRNVYVYEKRHAKPVAAAVAATTTTTIITITKHKIGKIQ